MSKMAAVNMGAILSSGRARYYNGATPSPPKFVGDDLRNKDGITPWRKSDGVARLGFEFWEEFQMVQLLKACVPYRHGTAKTSRIVARRCHFRAATPCWHRVLPPLIG
jgi:hypothetical protein